MSELTEEQMTRLLEEEIDHTTINDLVGVAAMLHSDQAIAFVNAWMALRASANFDKLMANEFLDHLARSDTVEYFAMCRKFAAEVSSELRGDEIDRLATSFVHRVKHGDTDFLRELAEHKACSFTLEEYARRFTDLDGWCENCGHPCVYTDEEPLLCDVCEEELNPEPIVIGKWEFQIRAVTGWLMKDGESLSDALIEVAWFNLRDNYPDKVAPYHDVERYGTIDIDGERFVVSIEVDPRNLEE